MNDSVHEHRFNAVDFRNVAARYVKLLIRARWSSDEFLTVEQLDEWKLPSIRCDNKEPWKLLHEAALTLATINEHYIPRCGSGGIPESPEENTLTRLMDAIAFLVDPEGGAPYHNEALVHAAAALREGGTVDWNTLVKWDFLPGIRRDLDELPRGDELSLGQLATPRQTTNVETDSSSRSDEHAGDHGVGEWENTSAGLDFDSGRQVVRNAAAERESEVDSQLDFKVLRHIARKGDRFTTRNELEDEWENYGGSSCGESSVDSRLTAVRRLAADLGLTLQNKRRVGWKLSSPEE